MARVHVPQYGQDYSVEPRRVVSVGELERIYGRNAQIELRPQSDGINSDAAYADTIELPMQRNRWLWVLLLLLVGAAGVVMYALYRNGSGAALAQRFGAVPSLHETESPPMRLSFEPPAMLVRISTEQLGALGNAKATTQLSEPVDSLTESSTTSGSTDVMSSGAATRSRPEDEAATRDALRLEAERVQREPRTTGSPQGEQPAPPSNPSPPGYIEAEIR